MGRVQKLPEEIVRGIAAGEVVERPASVLKELLENALDAGARRIEVEWVAAGRERLRVTDDGSGMSPDDARLALERHATSKIRTLADLERVATFGFRGEALPSIMAVSRFELVTRPPDAPQAWTIRAEGGPIVFDGPAGAPLGTSVVVEDLFFAVPARLKFLKSDATERALLFRTVEDVALSSPETAFRVLSESREALHLPGVKATREGMRERLAGLWGEDRVRSLKPVDEAGRLLRVSGWVSDANAPQPTARYQRLFINRRPVTSRRLLHAIYDGYRGQLRVGTHPAAVLFLDLDPAELDVNVHPAKREVRLSHETEVHDFLSRAVQNALSRSAQPVSAVSDALAPPQPITGGPPSLGHRPPLLTTGETRAAFQLQAPLDAPRPPNSAEGLPLETFRSARFDPLAQLYRTYILARWEDQAFLFDQHAADERVLYEILTEQASRGTPARQSLLLPWLWELSAEEAGLVQEHRSAFENLGYELEPFGGASWRVKAVPAALGEGDKVRTLLEGLVEDLLTGRIARGWDALVKRAACRGAVKAGDPLTVAEMARVIQRLQAAPHPWTCPHGRPAFLRLSDEDLAKRFHRV